MTYERIVHSIAPTFDENSRVLVLGSLPSPASREAGFNYGHPRNRFWQVMAMLAGEPLPTTTERRRDFCLRHHIALWDVVAECDIEGASDGSIRNARPNDLAAITRTAPICAVFCTGAKAHELYRRLGCEQTCGMSAVKLPSTSPANAACSLDELVEAYARIFDAVEEFEPPVLDVPQVVALEGIVAAHGTSLAELMDRAGAALAHRVGRICDGIADGTFARHADAVPGRQVAPGRQPGLEAAPGRQPGLEAASVAAPRREPTAASGAVVVLCGSGNNGGDGWVAAELLAAAGRPVCVVSEKAPDEIAAQPARDAAQRSLQALLARGAYVVEGAGPLPPDNVADGAHGEGEAGAASTDGAMAAAPGPASAAAPLVLLKPSRENVQAALRRACVVVDALLGTGFKGDSVKEPYASWIRLTNEGRARHVVVSADVASGVNAQTGAAAEPCVRADETLTMIVRKPGLVNPACGTVSVAPLGYIEPLLAELE